MPVYSQQLRLVVRVRVLTREVRRLRALLPKRCRSCRHATWHPSMPGGTCMHRQGVIDAEGFCENWGEK